MYNPDSALHLTNFQLFAADRDAESVEKSRGGGKCFYFNEMVYRKDVTVLKKMCCSDQESSSLTASRSTL